MRASARLWLVVVPAALLAGGIAIALALTSNHEAGAPIGLALAALVGFAFIFAGLVARTRRPENRTGLLLIGVGFAWFLNGLSFSNEANVWTLGYALGALWAAVFVHALLAYPSGRLEAPWQRAVVAGGYALALAANIAVSLFEPDPASCKDCPANQLLISDNHAASVAILTVVELVGAAYLISVAVALYVRWRSSTPVARRLLGPVLLAGGLSLALLGLQLGLQSISKSASGVANALAGLAFLTVPFLFLSGLMRTRLARGDVAKLLLETSRDASRAEAQDNLRRTLRDPTLELVFWLAERGGYVDVEGRPYELPYGDPARAVTPIDYDDRPVGALVHDPTLLDEPELIESFVAAARLAIERDRLQAELLARVADLQHERDFVRDVVNAAPSYFVVVDENGLLVRFNDTLRGAAGIPDDDSTRGRPWWEVFGVPDDAAGMRDWFLVEARQESEPATHEARTNARSGELVTSWSLVRLSDDANRSLLRSDEEHEQRWLLTGIDLTERVRQQRALETSERRSRALLEGVPDNIYRVARDGHRFLDIRWTDPTRLPVPQERFIGGTVRELGLPGNLADRFIDLAETAFATGRVESIEYAVEVGGEPLHLEARIVPSGDDEYFVTVRDVTDRVRAQHALETSEQRSRALLAGIPDNIFRVAHADHRVVDVRWGRRVRVLDPERVVGSTVEEAGIPKDVADRVVEAAERAFATGEMQELQYELVDAEGTMHLEARVVPSGDEYFVIVRDVSDRRAAEIALEAQRDFLSAVGDATPALLAVLAADGTMSGEPLNQALRELTGLTNDEVEGRDFFELVSTPGDAPRTERVVRTAADTGEPQSAETRWRGRDGERLVAWTATPLPDVERGGSTVLLSGVDITERAEQEEELRRSRARIVEAGDAERRRLERNLHDGAQQRLVSLSLSLRLAQARLKSDPQVAGTLLSGASEELALALEELRELARGIHPAVLTDRGLGPALESLADRAPLLVELEQMPGDRLPAPVEAAAFYVVAEALTNVAKYAGASSVRVSVERLNGRAVVEVADDGRGGADPAKGTGLRGLVDRLAALDGILLVDSPEGGGTRVRAEIPTSAEK